MKAKPVSFIEMYSSEHTDNNIRISLIEIPIIQRDYAQGRMTKEVSRIRKQFLNVLYNSLTGKGEPVKLDFIYGNITNDRLVPLDGQQRLTTLFLLHWYIARHENIDMGESSFLEKFTYRTRFSSRDFCEKLVMYTPDFSLESISEWIRDQNWFIYSWEHDPTIQSMLVMIDDIHGIFRNTTGLWKKLSESADPAISFYFLPLEEMGLSDNLYIKMNSRGKPLTEFEHFKAEFGKIVKNVSHDLFETFILKIDNDWTDLLWDYRGNDNIIDDEFMRYYRFITEMICYRNSIEIIENDFDLADKVYGSNGSAQANLTFLFDAFDCWKKPGNIEQFFSSHFSGLKYEKNKVKIYSETSNLFLQCCNDYGELVGDRNRKFSLSSSLLLYAVVQYLVNIDKISESEFTERIRIIRNLIWNSSDEIREKRMAALLEDTEKVILSGIIDSGSGGYSVSQKEEELEKISWRRENADLIDNLNRLEDQYLLQGSTAIISLKATDKFSDRAAKFNSLFYRNAIPYLQIGKALLTFGDYSQLASWRFLFGSSNNVTWRELFTVSKNRKNFENTRQCLSDMLDSLSGDFTGCLNSVIEKYLNSPITPKDWRYYFIKYDSMRKGNSGVFYWRNDPKRIKNNQYEIFMMNTSLSLNGKHWDPFLYTIYSDDGLNKKFSLDEFGSPLVLIKSGKKILCKNICWEIRGADDSIIQTIEIPQENGVDKYDRIDIIKEFITGEI